MVCVDIPASFNATEFTEGSDIVGHGLKEKNHNLPTPSPHTSASQVRDPPRRQNHARTLELAAEHAAEERLGELASLGCERLVRAPDDDVEVLGG
eukprot:2341129-Rhodomonas_salina.4